MTRDAFAARSTAPYVRPYVFPPPIHTAANLYSRICRFKYRRSNRLADTRSIFVRRTRDDLADVRPESNRRRCSLGVSVVWRIVAGRRQACCTGRRFIYSSERRRSVILSSPAAADARGRVSFPSEHLPVARTTVSQWRHGRQWHSGWSRGDAGDPYRSVWCYEKTI